MPTQKWFKDLKIPGLISADVKSRLVYSSTRRALSRSIECVCWASHISSMETRPQLGLMILPFPPTETKTEGPSKERDQASSLPWVGKRFSVVKYVEGP